MPCDCLLLSGSAVVSEVMLTGRACPSGRKGGRRLTTMLDVDGGIGTVPFGGTDCWTLAGDSTHNNPRIVE